MKKIFISAVLSVVIAWNASAASLGSPFGVAGGLFLHMVSYEGSVDIYNETIDHPHTKHSGVAHFQDEASLPGFWGGVSHAYYSTDLLGSIRSLVEVQVPSNGYIGGKIAADYGQARTNTSAWDTLTVRLPAKDYSDGASIQLLGTAKGNITLEGSEVMQGEARRLVSMSVNYLSHWERDDIDKADSGHLYGPYNTWSDDSSFNLQVPVLEPGTALKSPIDLTVLIYAELYNTAYAGHDPGFSLVNYSGTIAFTTFKVPDGATWTSASGRFMVPIPASAWLMLGGIGLLSRWVKRARCISKYRR